MAMPLTLNLDVQWPDGRLVHVRCTGLAELYELGEQDAPPEEVTLGETNVSSEGALYSFLAESTRISPDQGRVEVIGFRRQVLKIPGLLGITGPPADPIAVTLPQQ